MTNFSVNSVINLSLEALRKTYENHSKLGKKGKELMEKNFFGETSLVADFMAEETVINHLKESNLPIRIISEEHGRVDLSDNPIFLGVLDGIDGTDIYKEDGGRYSTLFGVFSSITPRYNDYLFSSILEYPKGEIYFATKNERTHLIKFWKPKKMKCSREKNLDKAKIGIDDGYGQDHNKRVFTDKLQKFNTFTIGSSGIAYADLACGKIEFVLECTRKKNLEIAACYGLVKEAGGIMLDINGQDIEFKQYNIWGQTEHIPIISACSKKIAKDLLALLR